MKRLILAGGGHVHVEVLRRFALRPPANAEIVVVTPSPLSPYSGMLPGHVEGLYSRSEMFIDVARLAAAAGARFVADRVTALDLAAREVQLADGSRLGYDLLSLDVGSTPAVGSATGVVEHALALKPIDAFLEGWSNLAERADKGAVRRVAVVGAGAAGVEMTLAMQHRLRSAAGGRRIEWHLFTDAAHILPAFTAGVRRRFEHLLAARDVTVHHQTVIARVATRGVHLTAGPSLDVDATIWATGAAAPSWLAAGGLRTDDAGFVLVDDELRSTSHAPVFAVGDAATMVGNPRPRSGVFAVRQGPPLAHNLRAALTGTPLARYAPQREALALITTGGRHAVAVRGALTVAGGWVWCWKDRIDRRFMARYRL